MIHVIQFLVNNVATEASDSGGGAGSIVSRLCGGKDILGAIKFAMTILDVMFIVIPIFLILLLSIDFAKNVIAKDEGDMKKNLSLAIKRLVMCVALFLVVPFTHAVVKLVGENGYNFLTCFDIAINKDISQYSVDDLFDFESTADSKDSGSSKYAPGSDISSSDGSSSSSGDGSSSSSGDGSSSSSGDGSSSSDAQNIFVGDSRTHGMQLVFKDSNGDIWFCKDGADYKWFIDSGIPSIKGEVGTHPDKKYNVFINMGVNDLNNQNLYVQQYAKIAEDYTNVKVIAVSVNKVDDSRSQYAKNTTIEAFNRVLSNKAKHVDRMVYCDTYSKVSFEFSDGIHYQPSTYAKIYNAMKGCA